MYKPIGAALLSVMSVIGCTTTKQAQVEPTRIDSQLLADCGFGEQICRGRFGSVCFAPPFQCHEGVTCELGQRLCVEGNTPLCIYPGQQCNGHTYLFPGLSAQATIIKWPRELLLPEMKDEFPELDANLQGYTIFRRYYDVTVHFEDGKDDDPMAHTWYLPKPWVTCYMRFFSAGSSGRWDYGIDPHTNRVSDFDTWVGRRGNWADRKRSRLRLEVLAIASMGFLSPSMNAYCSKMAQSHTRTFKQFAPWGGEMSYFVDMVIPPQKGSNTPTAMDLSPKAPN